MEPLESVKMVIYVPEANTDGRKENKAIVFLKKILHLVLNE